MVCFECGDPSESNYHVVPKILGGTKTVSLCLTCHGKVHDKDLVKMKKLSNEGIKRAKREGLYRGRRPGSEGKVAIKRTKEARSLRARGWKLQEFAEVLAVPKASVCRYLA